MNSIDLNGQIALVSGAGSGVGQAIAIGLASKKATVLLVGRNLDKLKKTQSLLEQQSLGQSAIFQTDISNPDAVMQMSQKVLNTYGPPAILINAAGVHGELRLISDSDPIKWINTMQTNIIGPYLVCRAFVNAMKQNPFGRIINISSAASLSAPAGVNSAYATSKVALNHFTRQLAEELKDTNITANVFHPGEVKTEMWAAIKAEAIQTGYMTKWVEWVEQTGGDEMKKSVDLIFYLLHQEAQEINGRFLWIQDGLKHPMPSWD